MPEIKSFLNVFKVSARTILELGAELISSDLIAFYELIKNGFDADSKNGVEIHFEILLRRNDHFALKTTLQKNAHLNSLKEAAISKLLKSSSSQYAEELIESIRRTDTKDKLDEILDYALSLNRIVVKDTGVGMSREDLVENFLVIGTPSRKRSIDKAIANSDKSSPYLGEKGIGRLSAMRLGNKLEVVSTKKKESHYNRLSIDWNEFRDLDAMIEDIEVHPIDGGKKEDAGISGTSIVISDLVEDWSRDRVIQLVELNLSKLTDPFARQRDRPRVVVIWNGERIQVPFMDKNLIKNAHAKISGSWEYKEKTPHLRCEISALDLGFEHPVTKEERIISLDDLQSLISGPSATEVHDEAMRSIGPFTFEVYWYNRRRLTKIEAIGDQKAVRDLQSKWSGVMLYRDGFRVFPYGEENDDWLSLDRKALGQKGYLLNKTQLVGRANISRTLNPQLIDQTNREGLRETPEQKILLEVMTFSIDTCLRDHIKEIERSYKSPKVSLDTIKTREVDLRRRASVAIKSLKKNAPPECAPEIEELQQLTLELSALTKAAQKRIDEAENEAKQMLEMAGVGLMIEVVAHELARATEAALENLDQLKSVELATPQQSAVSSLRSHLKSLSKRIRILDPLSISGRQTKETFNLKQLIDETIEAHESQFKRHGIDVIFNSSEDIVKIKAVRGMVVQILENLISNSKYWLELKSSRELKFQPKIEISITRDPLELIYSDNGKGIDPDNIDRVFHPFFSLKENSKRRGIGLYIARECAKYHGGDLFLSNKKDPQTQRLHTFVLNLP
ncbi:sensor histidine kinase [Pelagicoccus sp. SDUM812003]|uniref:sensor histidine kinase n=1 Tax=Pelagicoccus sp. SDUM812003 TaxID=3041267 RepID=UPI00280D90DE|nr:sensor histidine kinase [Pelagicoccus sp. SDUM812003]MDQ8203341.1 sensor histidine kinase [Pelagicoccus sp. SDUM812003]